MKSVLPKIDSSNFTFRRWESGTIHEIINAPCRFKYITKGYGKTALKKYAIGWCSGKNLLFKPKTKEVGIMCFKDGRHFWFHIRKEEFNEIWTDK